MTYHLTNHDDLRPDIFMSIEGLHEPDEVQRQRQAVEHSRPLKGSVGDSEAQDDRHYE